MSVGGCGLALVVVLSSGASRVCVRVSVSRLVRVSVSRLVRACVLSWDVIVVFPETRSRMFENAAPADESR